MKALPHAPALLAALGLLGSGCASSPWERVENVPGGKFYVPKLWAPLLPGSIYPDKNVPVPAKGRPAIVVVCPARGDCRRNEILDQASQRGLVVLIGKEPKDDLLRARAEVSAAHIGWLLVRPKEEFLGRWMEAGTRGAAVAVIGPPPKAGASVPPYPSKNLLFSALLESAPLEAKDGTVLKLYSPDQKGLLPSEAFRDAVEWLAAELGAR